MSMLRQYQIDAFTSSPFSGNPAAVVPLERWIPEVKMQQLASENNLSETAFFTPGDGTQSDFELRWFTPTLEIDLCGHATLATAHTLYRHMGWNKPVVRFATRSGLLVVEHISEMPGRYAMDFPTKTLEPVEIPVALVEAIGRRPAELYRGRKLLAVYGSKREIHEILPDFARLAAVEELTHTRGVICTAPGTSHDFVSRFFAPSQGVNEDPVTGSAHCVLAPFWASRLGRSKLSAHQVSKRGGEMLCEVSADGSRVKLTGDAVSVIESTIFV